MLKVVILKLLKTYDGAVMSVRTTFGEIDEFPMIIGLHPKSTLIPYLFALIRDELAAHI